MLKKLLIKLIDSYRAIAPTMRANSPCRFTPTCSQYAKEAIEHYGILGGIARASRRISRCHPFSQGGHDPVK